MGNLNDTFSHRNFLEEISEYFENNIDKMFKKHEDRIIAYSVLQLINKIDEIENFNKKAIYILLRELTGRPTAKVTRVINTLKSKYRKLKLTYTSKGTIRI